MELHWPADAQAIPSPESVEVRSYPTAFGWFGWTVDRVLSGPEIAVDRRTWIYKSDPTLKMDSAYSARVPAATEMVAMFCDDEKSGVRPPVPAIRMLGPNIGTWKRMDVEIEWGFQSGTENKEFDGRLEPYVAKIGPVAPLAEDKGTRVTGGQRWRSRAAGNARRGIVVPLLYAPNSRPGLDSRITVWSGKTGFTFRISDLDNGPVYMPEHGVFVTKAGSGQTARQFTRQLAARNLEGLCQMAREHPEAASWDELMREARLWNGQSLWVARATPRAWLQQGRRIALSNAPTCFGNLAYEIVSDGDNSKITATIEMPNRRPVESVILRLRHPKAARIKSVMVNGQPWTGLDKDKEIIELRGLTGNVTVAASYY